MVYIKELGIKFVTPGLPALCSVTCHWLHFFYTLYIHVLTLTAAVDTAHLYHWQWVITPSSTALNKRTSTRMVFGACKIIQNCILHCLTTSKTWDFIFQDMEWSKKNHKELPALGWRLQVTLINQNIPMNNFIYNYTILVFLYDNLSADF